MEVALLLEQFTTEKALSIDLKKKLNTYLKFNSILDTRMNGLEDTSKNCG